MTNPNEDLLTTTEGVDEGSAASTAERARGKQPEGEATPAPPVDVAAVAGGETRGPGQQLEAGEG